jgi:TetR/AcrR family fatty acid metabolism transcriptional regulator
MDKELTKVQKKKQQKRKAILQAALQIFITQGYHEAKITEIARRAKVADGTIYLYFKDKPALMVAVFKMLIDERLTAWESQLDGTQSHLDLLRQFFFFHADFFTQNPTFARFFAIELRQAPLDSRSNRTDWPLYHYHRVLKSLIIGAMQAGEIRPIRDDVLIALLLGTMEYVLTEWVVNDYQESLHEINELVIDILHNGLNG